MTNVARACCCRAAEAGWLAGRAEHAVALLDEARAATADPGQLVEIDYLAGHIAVRRGPVRRGHDILIDAAERADPERAVAILAEAASACFYAADPAEMLVVAERASAAVPEGASPRTRFLAATALGMARIVGGDAAAGAEAIHEAIALAEGAPHLHEDLELLPWLAVAPIFLREAQTGRSLLERALREARSRAAVGVLPFVLNLIARDEATTDRWAIAESTYREAIDLAGESDQRTDLAMAMSGLVMLDARRGREAQCRDGAREASALSTELGTQLIEVWTNMALGELELGLGDAAAAAERFADQRRLLEELGITDVDLSPAPELVEAYLRLGRDAEARQLADEVTLAATAKGQPWSLARSLRCAGLVGDEAAFADCFERALAQHALTPDAFETARTQLAYGERLRRGRQRVRAREQLRAALETFESLDAAPWSERARAELAASGETLRARDPSTLDELTPQELQIALLLAAGRTTREAAAAVFLSPKTVEYHLRHVYLKLGIHSREELARALAGAAGDIAGGVATVPSG